MALAADGGFLGFSYSSTAGKVQLFREGECEDPTTLGNNADDWYIFKTGGCPYLSPPPPPLSYCLATSGFKCNDFTRQTKYEHLEDGIAFAREKMFAGFAYNSEKSIFQFFEEAPELSDGLSFGVGCVVGIFAPTQLGLYARPSGIPT
ncbi:hypothetical protein CYMTET_36584 [Cymbomonas tetramitiformis]|uniref:Uncharacterized protein n=1 Tax=Cymbomonas tetramitiformis TaxID=36881 RepID=A0AAE0F735_9CHLO|nr:hypothetical protein CYMTET_36584 [Cymbomonas tetramitiformis]